MDSFGILGGLLGGALASGEFTIRTATVARNAPFNSAKDILIVLGRSTVSVLSGFYTEPQTLANFGPYSKFTSTSSQLPVIEWAIPGKSFIPGISVSKREITSPNQPETALIIIASV